MDYIQSSVIERVTAIMYFQRVFQEQEINPQ